MNKVSETVVLQFLLERHYLGVVDKEVTPRHVGILLYHWTSLFVWLRNVGALWKLLVLG